MLGDRPAIRTHPHHSSLGYPNQRTWRNQYAEMLLQQDSSDGSTTYNTPAHKVATTASSSASSTANQEMWVQQKRSQNDSVVNHTVVFSKSILCIWAILTTVLFIVCCCSLSQPHWLQSSDGPSSLGLINHCVIMRPFNENTLGSARMSCQYFRGAFGIMNLPSLSWRITLVLFLISCTLLGAGGLLAVICLCLNSVIAKQNLTFIAGYCQLAAAVLMITALLVYPVGFDSPQVRLICGESSMFNPGDCYIGWSYVLAITSAALCCLLPVLSHYADYPLCSHKALPDPVMVT